MGIEGAIDAMNFPLQVIYLGSVRVENSHRNIHILLIPPYYYINPYILNILYYYILRMFKDTNERSLIVIVKSRKKNILDIAYSSKITAIIMGIRDDPLFTYEENTQLYALINFGITQAINNKKIWMIYYFNNMWDCISINIDKTILSTSSLIFSSYENSQDYHNIFWHYTPLYSFYPSFNFMKKYYNPIVFDLLTYNPYLLTL